MKRVLCVGLGKHNLDHIDINQEIKLFFGWDTCTAIKIMHSCQQKGWSFDAIVFSYYHHWGFSSLRILVTTFRLLGGHGDKPTICLIGPDSPEIREEIEVAGCDLACFTAELPEMLNRTLNL